MNKEDSDESVDSFLDYGSPIQRLLDLGMVPGTEFYLRCLKCGKGFKSLAIITSSELITCSCGSTSIAVIEIA